MKLLTGTIERVGRDLDGNGVVVLTVPSFHQTEMVKELDKSKTYNIEIKEIKSDRTGRQNRYLWKLIRLIDEVENGRTSRDGMESLYIELLERANAKVDFIMALPEAESLLRKSFRAVKFITEVAMEPQDMNMYKVVVGSSKMNTKEMSDLIDATLDYAYQVGIDSDYWKELLK